MGDTPQNRIVQGASREVLVMEPSREGPQMIRVGKHDLPTRAVVAELEADLLGLARPSRGR